MSISKRNGGKVVKYAFSILPLLILVSGVAYASEFIAVLQYTNQDDQLTQIVYQLSVPTKGVCEALNGNYWKGVRTSCPSCVKEIEGCVKSLPKGYEPILHNKPIVFPYISFGEYRVVFMGVPMEEAKRQCKYQAAALGTKLNREVIVVFPTEPK